MASRFLQQTSGVMPNGDTVIMQSYIVDQFNYDQQVVPLPNLGIPILAATNNVAWYYAEISPISFQGALNFGRTYSIQFTLGKVQASVTTTPSTSNVPGRVMILVPDSGQTFLLPTRYILSSSSAIIANTNLTENYMAMIPVIMNEGGRVKVWLEPDVLNGAVTVTYNELRLTLFNRLMPSFGLY